MNKFDELFNKAKAVANAAGKKTGEMVEVSKLKLQVVQLNSDVDKIYKRIGELTYIQSRNNTDAKREIETAMAEIDKMYQEIEALNIKINDAQQMIKCQNCGAANSVDAIFCSRCGKSLNETANAEPENYVDINYEIVEEETAE